jgi:hypothetical protein
MRPQRESRKIFHDSFMVKTTLSDFLASLLSEATSQEEQ